MAVLNIIAAIANFVLTAGIFGVSNADSFLPMWSVEPAAKVKVLTDLAGVKGGIAQLAKVSKFDFFSGDGQWYWEMKKTACVGGNSAPLCDIASYFSTMAQLTLIGLVVYLVLDLAFSFSKNKKILIVSPIVSTAYTIIIAVYLGMTNNVVKDVAGKIPLMHGQLGLGAKVLMGVAAFKLVMSLVGWAICKPAKPKPLLPGF